MSIRILLLDDEPVIVDTLCFVLTKVGYTAKAVYTQNEAVRVAREFRPDVFLTGFNNLCDKDGCETATEILEFLPHCRVVISSGNRNAGDALREYARCGYKFECLSKPAHPKDLIALLRASPPE